MDGRDGMGLGWVWIGLGSLRAPSVLIITQKAKTNEKGQNKNETRTWDEEAFFGYTHCDTSAEHLMMI